MNKVIMMARLAKDPEIRYAQATGNAIASYSIAVNRRFKKEGEPEADFFNCVSFGKTAEFIEKYLRKGTKVVLEGEVQNNNYTNQQGEKIYSTRILVNTIEFAESKGAQGGQPQPAPDEGGFMPVDIEEELPFN